MTSPYVLIDNNLTAYFSEEVGVSELAGKVVYIAGPITGMEQQAISVFGNACRYLQNHYQAIVLNPALLPKGLKSHQSYMNICLPMVREAEVIVFLPGWRQSVGAGMEYDEATAIGIPMFEMSFPNETSPGESDFRTGIKLHRLCSGKGTNGHRKYSAA